MDPKDRIREAAFALFTGIGYSGVTMDQVARRCGIGKATLYKHFPSKEALLLSCVDYFTEKIGSEVEGILQNPDLPPHRKVTEFVLPVVRFASGVNAHVLEDIQRSVPEAYQRIEANRKKIILSNLVRIVREGKEEGIFREDLNGTLVAHMLIGATSHLITPQVLEEIGLPIGTLFETAVSMIWEGCLSEAGRGMVR
ncbi:MAG TPA: TetR/AcrR family transcriptional regulator [Clostridia bacterium]|nr:TetR/AcrR family transcriptional regulator [Clostridia bacterium]